MVEICRKSDNYSVSTYHMTKDYKKTLVSLLQLFGINGKIWQ